MKTSTSLLVSFAAGMMTPSIASAAATAAAASAGSETAATPGSSPLASALLDALESTTSEGPNAGRRRQLAWSEACHEESVLLSLCLPDAAESDCNACVSDSFRNAFSLSGTTTHPGCDEMAEVVCAPARDCPCLSNCMDEYNAGASCVSDEVMKWYLSFEKCNLTCNGESPTTNNGIGDRRFAPVGEVDATSGLRSKKAVP